MTQIIKAINVIGDRGHQINSQKVKSARVNITDGSYKGKVLIVDSIEWYKNSHYLNGRIDGIEDEITIPDNYTDVEYEDD